MIKLTSLLLIIAFMKIRLIHCNVINMTAYYQIPPLYKLDDYDRCLNEFPDQQNIYCYVDVTIAPNNSNAAWQYIEKISTDTKHYFRHDRLKRGLCLSQCEVLCKNMLNSMEQLWYQPLNFDPNLNYLKLGSEIYKNSLWYRERYNHLVNMCVNKELKPNYELMAYSEILYCDSRNSKVDDNIFAIDMLDIWFLIIITLIFVLTVASSIIDQRMKKSDTLDHYHTPPTNFKISLLVSFSVYRNYYKIINGSETKENREIKVINALRFLFMYLAIVGHFFIGTYVAPIANPEYLEENYHRVMKMLLINGQTLIQTFYTITGFLMAFKFLQFQQNLLPIQVNFKDLFKGILQRYFRLTPVYGLMILFNMTWMIRLGTGPLWRYSNEVEREFCRANWWTNLLYINNYINSDKPCLQQGWYLGTDLQLFITYLFLLILITKVPKLKRVIIILCITFSIIVPAVIAYVHKFEGIVITYPELLKYYMWYSEMYQQFYIPMHTNTGSYLIGIISGWLWYYIKRDNIDLTTYKLVKFLYPFLFPITALCVLSGYVFYAYEFEKPAVWISCYATFAKHYWGFSTSALIICTSAGIGGLLKDILNSKMFNILGRITFCAYIVHMAILRIFFILRQPVIQSDIRILMYTSSACLFSFLAGFVLSLCIEMPCSNLLKLSFPRPIKEKFK